IKNWLFCVNTIDSLFVYFVRAPDMRKVRPSPSALAIRCVGKLRGLPLCLPFAMPIFRSHRTGTLGQGYAHIPPCSPLTVTRARNDRLCLAPLGKRSYFATLSTRQSYFPRPLTSLIRTFRCTARGNTYAAGVAASNKTSYMASGLSPEPSALKTSADADYIGFIPPYLRITYLRDIPPLAILNTPCLC